MNNLVQFRSRTPEKSDGFYHPDHPCLYAMHDTITDLHDCPFPLKTDTFEVVLFGTSVRRPDAEEKGHGRDSKFAVVQYRKTCGHLCQERITFIEGVKTFMHCGTEFRGEDYSIENWRARIEFFRTNLPCEVCSMVRHCLWIHYEKLGSTRGWRKNTDRCLLLLEHNFANWREFVPEQDILRWFRHAGEIPVHLRCKSSRTTTP